MADHEVQGAVTALGCLDGDNYEKEPDCFETVKDIIRYLRRDTDTFSYKVRLQITSLNVIEKDLIPILRTYPDEEQLFEATLRLMINLTQPVVEKKNPDAPVDKESQSKMVSQRLQLIGDLKRTKRAFANLDLLTVLTDKLKKLLCLDWEQREEEDRLLIERLLILVRNILHIPPPDEDVTEKTAFDLTAHDQIVWVMHKCKLDDLLLDLACADSQREFHIYVLEIISLILRQHAPEVLASTGVDRTVADQRKEQQELASIHAKETSKKLGQHRRCTGRHTSFAGAYTLHGVKGLNETKDLVSPRPVTKTEDLSFDSRKQRRKIPRNRAPAPETTGDPSSFSSTSSSAIGRRSAFEIRIILKEFCRRFVDAGYNKFMHSIEYALERRVSAADGGSRIHFWWLVRYLTAFVRYQGSVDPEKHLKWKSVQETLSVHCLHEAQTQLEECIDMITIEKKDARQWGRKAHVVLRAYGELLMMLQVMERGKDEEAIDMAMELKKTVFYVMEYRELLIMLLKKYKPAVFTKSFLKDLVEITHVYLKMLESHCLVYGDELKVQKKRKKRRQQKRAKGKKGEETVDEQKGVEGLTEEEKRIRLEDAWQSLADDLSTLLQRVETEPGLLPVDVVPFDSVAEHGFDEKIVAQIRIQNALKVSEIPKALALLRSSRAIWPDESTLFGRVDFSGPEDDFLLLRNVFLTELPVVPGENDKTEAIDKNDQAEPDAEDGDPARAFFDGEKGDGDDDSDDDEGGYVTSEVQFSFNQYVQRFAHSDVFRWYITLLSDFSSNTVQFNHCLTKMMHRIAYDLKLAPLLYQARLFRTFQKLLNTPGFANLPGANELITFAKHFLPGFFIKAKKNKDLFIEMLFWKGFKEAYEIEYGYGSLEEKKKEKSKKKAKKASEEPEYENETRLADFVDKIVKTYQPPAMELRQYEEPKVTKKRKSKAKIVEEPLSEKDSDVEQERLKKKKKILEDVDDDIEDQGEDQSDEDGLVVVEKKRRALVISSDEDSD